MIRLNKKGDSHADWAISLGIFLLYVLSMMMIIQPGIQPIYKEDRLLQIVKDNYREATAFTFYKTPVFINTTKLDAAGSYKVTISGDLPFSGDGNNFAVINASGTVLANQITLNELVNDTIAFTALVALGSNQFYIISNAKADGTSVSYDKTDPLPGTEISNIAVPDANFTVLFGSTEPLTGVDISVFNTLVTENGVKCGDKGMYDALKGRWKFPRSKEFVTYYATTANPRYTMDQFVGVCNQTVPFQQANVFIEEWATNALDEFGAASPVRMGVKVW